MSPDDDGREVSCKIGSAEKRMTINLKRGCNTCVTLLRCGLHHDAPAIVLFAGLPEITTFLPKEDQLIISKHQVVCKADGDNVHVYLSIREIGAADPTSLTDGEGSAEIQLLAEQYKKTEYILICTAKNDVGSVKKEHQIRVN